MKLCLILNFFHTTKVYSKNIPLFSDTRFIMVFYPNLSCYILIMNSLEYSMDFFKIRQKKRLGIAWSWWTKDSSL